MFRTCIVDTSSNLVVNIVEYDTQQTGTPPGMADTFLCVPSDTGQIGGTYANGVITNPAPVFVITADMNKDMASSFLSATDWATIADVSDPAKSNPYLTNASDFNAYRNTIRAIAINPPAGPITWATVPTPKWSN